MNRLGNSFRGEGPPRRFGRGVRAVGQVSLACVAGLAMVLGPVAAGASTVPSTSASTSTSQPAAAGVASTTTTSVASSGSTGPSTTTTTATTSGQSTVSPKAGVLFAPQPHGAVTLNGVGSSFAAPAISQWTKDVQNSPYNLNLNYSSTNSGDGRYQFTNQTTDFAASDIAYAGSSDTAKPGFPFIFVPVTAGGIAFMYNIPGLHSNLQLSSYTACAILTGGITNWDDSQITADNGGVAAPNLPIVPVTESDSAGTNFVLEEWCIAEQSAVWAAFANSQLHQNGGPTDGVAISPTAPNSNWPGVSNGLDVTTTTAVAGDIATRPGAIGAVQEQYAADLNFGKGDVTKGIASVKNSSGQYTQPSAVDVSSALAYATQLADGTHQLNFNGVGPHVYNPSTYSYLLTPTTGWSPSKGAVLSGFVNYVLTLGQQQAPSFGYAGLGLSLEQYGIKAVTADVPGAVATTAAEAKAFACGDLTPTEVAAGQTTPTCGVVNATAPIPPANGGSLSGGAGGAGGAGSAAHLAGAGGSGSSGGAGGGSGGAGGVDPGVSLGGSTGLAFTGMDIVPLVLLGTALLLAGWIVRRRLGRTLRTSIGGPKP
jgi:phosphate transport system substrate-binding protein